MRTFLLLFSLFSLSTVLLQANDASIGGIGSDLVLLSEGRIRMVSEDIRLVQKYEGVSDWTVYAHYIFENPTSDTVTIRMGFPEKRHCEREEEDYGDSYDPRFRNLQVRINGNPVAYDTGTVQRNEWEFCLGTVYIFEVSFAPGERKQVDHTYEYTGSSSVMGVEVDYLTRTGRLWNGPIGSARFTVAIAGFSSWIAWPEEYHLVEYYRDRFPTDPYGTVRSVYTFHQREWKPESDFTATVNVFYEDELPDCCPQRWEREEAMRGADPKGELRKLLECLPDDSIRICRNLVFARYGRPFADSILDQRFYPPATRRPDYWDDDDGLPYLSLGYFRNPRYSDELLSREDREFVAILKQIEDERSGLPGDE